VTSKAVSTFVSVSGLADALSSDDPPVVLDATFVLHPAEFDGDYRTQSGRSLWIEGHIPGSQHVDIPTEFSDATDSLHYSHPEPQAVADALAALGIGKHTKVVVYDSTDTMFAARLWYLLHWIGVDTAVLDGGLRAWVAAGNHLDTGEGERAEPVDRWQAKAERRAWLSKQELLEREVGDNRPLVCGLTPAAFAGTSPSRYSRRGHIPGSVNVSARDLFTSDGTVKSRVELILAYDAAGVDVADRSEEVLLYCGGGISASANALTLAAIGTTAVRIYDGSLEEWSADEALPLALGT
jgi:thiosulfate/3-mercaptopyruvate sulfurtransferase